MKLINIIIVLFSSLYFISCGKDVSVTPPDAPAPTGAFAITSNPPGAEIFVNNRTTGRVTPDSLSWLSAGKYDIKLRLPLYRDTVLNINISEENKTSVSVDFTANPAMRGSIICQSKPNRAEIFLNGQPTQKYTPDTIKGLLPGVYNITFKSDGCRNDSVSVVVKSHAMGNAFAQLQDTTIWMTYNTSNSNLPTDYLTSIVVGGNDWAWIGTLDRGLVCFDGRKWTSYNTSNSALPSNTVSSLAIYSFRAGTFLYEKIYIGTPQGLAILSITTDDNGRTVGSTMYVFNKTNSPLPDNNVTSVAVDRWSYAWVGTQKGLMLIPDDFNQMKAYDLTTFGENSVTCVAATAPAYGTKHEVYIGLLTRGLISFDYSNNNWMHYESPAANLHNNQLRSISAVRWGDVYFGCAATKYQQSTLGRLVNDAFNHLQLGTGTNSYNSVVARLDGSIWICTSEGLFYRESEFTQIKEYNAANSGIQSNILSGIAFDSYGKAWIATAHNGLVLYKKYLDK